MAGTDPAPGIVYLVNVPPEILRELQNDLRADPLGGWQAQPLSGTAPMPPDVRAGRAVLVVGCGGRPVEHSESIGLMRLVSSGCPWLVLGVAPDPPSPAECAAAGAVASVSYPCTPAALRKAILDNAPSPVRSTPPTVSSDRFLRTMAVLRADILLKFSSLTGRTGFLILARGRPRHAKVLGGPEGPAALRDILGWGKGKVLAQQSPTKVPSNLPADSIDWLNLPSNPAPLNKLEPSNNLEPPSPQEQPRDPVPIDNLEPINNRGEVNDNLELPSTPEPIGNLESLNNPDSLDNLELPNIPEPLGNLELPDTPEPPVANSRASVPAGSPTCDMLLAEFPSATASAIVDLTRGVTVGVPTAGGTFADDEARFLSELLNCQYLLPTAESHTEAASDVTLLGADCWFAAARIEGGLGVLLSGDGVVHLGLVQTALATAAPSLDGTAAPVGGGNER